jgi:long-chain acyl-CoA synthetase
MTAVGQFVGKLEEFGGREAMIWRDRMVRFEELLADLKVCQKEFEAAGIRAGSVITVEGDFSPAAVVALLAGMELGAIMVPLTASVESKKPEFCETAEVEWRLVVDEQDRRSLSATGQKAVHGLFQQLRAERHPGLVLFSSGSTGRSKAVVHDLEFLVRKYLQPRHCYRTLAFLLFDHIGGIDTLFYNLANGSCLVTVPDLRPETVCAAIAAHGVEVLPVSPTFINLLLLNRADERHDLGSLKIITYGAEVMPPATLARLHDALPKVKLIQKFGATEIGTMRSQSRSSDSVWVKIGGEGYQTRVVDGLLEIKAESAMLGYLNAPTPFTEDGWFKTGDAVEVSGEWLRILGRRSEVINVGGEKVHPAEVEGVLQGMEGVEEATVVGEANAITGHIVLAKVRLTTAETASAFRQRMWAFCRDRLPGYKIPQKVKLVDHTLTGARFKKMRRDQTEA